MNCTKCGKKIKLIRARDGREMIVDELMAYVFPSDFAPLTVITPSGEVFHARVATEQDKRVVRAHFLHNANCRADTPKYVIEARAEYQRRQNSVIDAQQAFQRKRYNDTHQTDQPTSEPQKPREVAEQMSLYSYLS